MRLTAGQCPAEVDDVIGATMRANEVTLQAPAWTPAVFDVADLKPRPAALRAIDMFRGIQRQLFGCRHPFG